MRRRGSHRGWNPVDTESREALLFMQKWQRRDLYFYGGMALFFLILAGVGAWSALNGSPWSWLTVAVDLGLVGLYGWRTQRAFERWLMIQEILEPEPNPD
jgi:hypothetical protein